jgi:hypothetical protein
MGPTSQPPAWHVLLPENLCPKRGSLGVLFKKRGQRNVAEAERLDILLSIIIDAHLDIDSAIAETTETRVRVAPSTETRVRVALSYSAPLQTFAHAFHCLAFFFQCHSLEGDTFSGARTKWGKIQAFLSDRLDA